MRAPAVARVREAAVAACAWALALVAGCGAASPDLGLAAAMQVAGAQFVPGPLPAPGGGPVVASLQFSDGHIFAGEQDRPLLGALGPTATSVLLALDDDRGYWIVGAGVPSITQPTLPTFSTTVGFARDLAGGTRTIAGQAVDAQGRVGAATATAFTVTADAVPSGTMVVHLSWNDHADLDLHVVDPDGVEIWSRHPSGYQAPPPPATSDPVAQADAPALDFDSNGGCLIDGRDQENVVWPTAPAPGHYIVRVDAASLCGSAYADWTLQRYVDGAVVDSAGGEALPDDTRGDHEAGAGRTALEFDVP